MGECGGGLIAYEIAQQLRAAGQTLALLLLMDTPRADVFWAFRQRVLDPLEKNYYVQRWSFHREQLHRLKGINKLGYLLQKGSGIFRELPQIKESLAGREPGGEVEYVQRSYSRAIYGYRPAPYPGKMTLLVNEEYHGKRPDLGWRDCVTGGVEIHKLPGNHTSYIRDHVQVTAKQIRACLERIDK